ncbi:MAG: Hsp20/alpha crystallin family protein [archaeon]|nr:Hsp20/alpha crystallin family protein [archaeon]MCP8321392.1 Hsp20/alpha crystallin family protein [archaeon]
MSEEKTPKTVMSPSVVVSHNEKDEGYVIEVKLPGVKKGDVELYFWSKGFCVDGKREDMTYTGCYNLAHEVKTEEAKAKFESGLLTITVPFKEKLRAKKVKIE